jgi:hypothetical protein
VTSTDRPAHIEPMPAPGFAPGSVPGWGLGPREVPESLARRMVGPVAAAFGAAAVTVYVGLVDPNRPGHYPVCPFLKVTGLYCPGCGGLRCVHALAHGDLPAAFGFNALAVLMVPLIVVIWLRWTIRAVRGTVRTTVADPRLIRALVAVILLFAVLRNLPFADALAP